ncbi:MAG TPA: SDR family NAD(P)-dependent oxidoreductase, partial [Abditibacterium sp.]
MTINLSGQTALITGASGELGTVMARTLAGCGADIAVHFHSNSAQAAKVVAEVEGLGRRAHAFQADVSNAESVAAMRVAIDENLSAP